MAKNPETTFKAQFKRQHGAIRKTFGDWASYCATQVEEHKNVAPLNNMAEFLKEQKFHGRHTLGTWAALYLSLSYTGKDGFKYDPSLDKPNYDMARATNPLDTEAPQDIKVIDLDDAFKAFTTTATRVENNGSASAKKVAKAIKVALANLQSEVRLQEARQLVAKADAEA